MGRAEAHDRAMWTPASRCRSALFDKMLAAKNFQSGMQTVRQIEFSLFDMHLHYDFDPASGQTALQLLDEIRRQVAVVIPPAYNRFPNNFSHIFAGGYAAGYYSYKWAEVLSADAYSLFEEKRRAAANRKSATASGARSSAWAAAAPRSNRSRPSAAASRASTRCCGTTAWSRSLSDLKEIGCKSAWAVHISPLFWSIERLLTCKTSKICPRPAEFCEQPLRGLPAKPDALRFFKSD